MRPGIFLTARDFKSGFVTRAITHSDQRLMGFALRHTTLPRVKLLSRVTLVKASDDGWWLEHEGIVVYVYVLRCFDVENGLKLDVVPRGFATMAVVAVQIFAYQIAVYGLIAGFRGLKLTLEQVREGLRRGNRVRSHVHHQPCCLMLSRDLDR